jgi:hypothetical protein
MMAARFTKPAGQDLSVDQRQLVGDIVNFVSAGEYDVGHLMTGRGPFVDRMKQVCASDAACAAMLAEVERWMRWQRVSS